MKKEDFTKTMKKINEIMHLTIDYKTLHSLITLIITNEKKKLSNWVHNAKLDRSINPKS